MKKTYFIRVFGCQMNEADGQKIAAWYENRGWRMTDKMEQADEIVIVSCSVRQSAENRAYGLINNLTNQKIQIETTGNTPDVNGDTSGVSRGNIVQHSVRPRIVLTGCILRYPLEKLRKKLPSVNEFKKISEFYEQVCGNTSEVNGDTSEVSRRRIVDSRKRGHLQGERERTALVPITEGCSHFCTYCVVPSARGPEKSRPFEEIICEVENLANRGVKEILLLGQNVNSYGKNPNFQLPISNQIPNSKSQTSFAILLRKLHEIVGLEKISFLTSNPWDLTDDIIEAMKLPKIDRYLHLPVQAGDNEILRRMNRPYSAKEYLNLVYKIREAIPDITIGTDIIVGFPGETKEQFQKTVDLCEKAKFIKAYVAEYSPRPNTTAYAFKDDVPPKEKKRRWRILEKLINKKSRV